MALYDQSELLSVNQSLPPASRTASANGTTVSTSDYESVMVTFAAGTVTDGTHTPSVEVSQDGGSTWTALTDADLVGPLVAITTNSTQTVGYVGRANAVRAVVTVAGATSGGTYAATVTLGNKGSL